MLVDIPLCFDNIEFVCFNLVAQTSVFTFKGQRFEFKRIRLSSVSVTLTNLQVHDKSFRKHLCV